MILMTERLILRPWEETDAEDLYEYAKDDRVGPAAGWLPHTSVENSREIIRTVLSAPETYAVCRKEDNKAIGSVGLMIGGKSNACLPETEGEIGYWIGVPFWGQGLIPEAVRELIRRAFADLRLETLWCGYFDGNEKSKRVQEKCGFTYHHTNKDIHWKLTGDIRTEHLTRLTRQAWTDGFSVRSLLSVYEMTYLHPVTEKASVELTPYSPDFQAAYKRIYNECFHDMREALGIEPFDYIQDDSFFETGMDTVYLLVKNREIVGSVALKENEIDDLFVDPKYQGMGYGRQILLWALAHIRSDRRITLHVAAWNRKAVALYEKTGFVITETTVIPSMREGRIK